MDYGDITAFCINLKHHPQKWEKSFKALSENGFKNIRRIEGVYGKELSQEYIEQNVSVYARFLLKNPEQRCSHDQLTTLGAIGCYLSHVMIWKTIVNENLENAFVFEDDLSFVKEFKNTIPHYLSNLNSNIDVFSFGYNNKDNNSFMGTQGYYITNDGAKKLLQYAFPIESHIDRYMGISNNIRYINLFFSPKTLVIQNNINGSSVSSSYFCWKCILPSNVYLFILYLLVFVSVFIFVMTKLIFYNKKIIITYK